MRYVALAAGFDGVLARDDHCDERCIDALQALSATGRKLILVTGRELRELLEMFPEARMFDYVVAENGAVMYHSATRQSEILAQAPPEILLQELRRRNVAPLTVGSSIVRTAPENEREVVEALRRFGNLLGIAFQMADDMVDFSQSSGKPVGLDIRQRVPSLPLIYAAEDREVGPEVRRLLAGALGEAEVSRVAELVAASDALPRVQDEARNLVDAAVRELDAVQLDGLRTTLVGLARSAVDRVA